MKRILLIFTCLTLLISLAACGNQQADPEPAAASSETTTETTTEATTEATTETPTTTESAPTESTNDFSDQVETLLTNVFDIDGFKTIVTVEGNEATVVIFYSEIAELFSSASSGDSESIETWDTLVETFLKLHNSARSLMENYGEYSLCTIIASDDFPYISIDDGEVTIDMLHLGE